MVMEESELQLAKHPSPFSLPSDNLNNDEGSETCSSEKQSLKQLNGSS
jgi:hypothetical protein